MVKVGGFTKSNKVKDLWLVILLNIAGGSVAIILSKVNQVYVNKHD